MLEEMKLDVNIIKSLSGASTAVATLWLPLFNEYLPKYDINTPQRVAAFLSQTGHESGGLLYTREIADGSAYEGRLDLGNINPGDGKKFKGRGLIQTTGRSNYQKFENEFNIPVISNPDLLGGQYATTSTEEQRKNSLLAALFYWKTHNLNALADKLDLQKPVTSGTNLDTVTKITKVINGGVNGLQDRISKLETGRDYVKDIKDLAKKNIGPIVLLTLGLLTVIITGYKFATS